MIRTEPLTAFAPGTEQLLFPYAAEEFLLAGPMQTKILEQSEAARIVYHGDRLLCYAGIVRPSMIEPPVLWVLLAKGVTKWASRHFRQLARFLSELHPHTRTVIEVSHAAGHRFAAFCGFRSLGIFVEFAGKRFEYYEVI